LFGTLAHALLLLISHAVIFGSPPPFLFSLSSPSLPIIRSINRCLLLTLSYRSGSALLELIGARARWLLLLAAFKFLILVLSTSTTRTRQMVKGDSGEEAARMDVDPELLPLPGQLVDGRFETEHIQM
jgi:hypothetical protein